jgi:hypothetical protein
MNLEGNRRKIREKEKKSEGAKGAMRKGERGKGRIAFPSRHCGIHCQSRTIELVVIDFSFVIFSELLFDLFIRFLYMYFITVHCQLSIKIE